MKSFLLVAVALAAAGTPLHLAGQVQVIANGGFENVTLSPWTASGAGSATISNISPFDGSQLLNLGFTTTFGEQSVRLSQSFTLAAPAVLTLSFAERYLDFTGLSDAPHDFFVSVDGVDAEHSPVPFVGSSAFEGPWTVRTASFALAAGTHTLELNASRGATGFGRGPSFQIDGVSLGASPVPEPSVVAAAVAGRARRAAGGGRRAGVANRGRLPR